MSFHSQVAALLWLYENALRGQIDEGEMLFLVAWLDYVCVCVFCCLKVYLKVESFIFEKICPSSWAPAGGAGSFRGICVEFSIQQS